MPRIISPQLTMTTVNNTDTTIKVTYNAVFTPFERHLANAGLRFVERIEVIGVDPPGGYSGRVLATFLDADIPIAGDTHSRIARNRSIPVARASLQEDPALGDDDEIRCRISIIPVSMPTTVVDFTPQQVLGG